jgi:glycosyltransferase involved in cell wall biosynthesis
MLFSIVIPVYNVEKYFEECLRSIIPQALDITEGCEIILVDDGSTDSSGIICDDYKTKYPGLIQVYHRSNHGLLLTRRFGYQHTSGQYIINCDSDDMLEKNALETLKQSIIEYDYPDIIIFNYFNLKGQNKIEEFADIFTNEQSCRVEKEKIFKEYLSGYSINSVCGGLCSRKCIDIERDYSKFKGLNNGEDSLQKIEQFDRANTFVYVNKPLYDYRIGSGMTGKFDPTYYQSFKVVFAELKKQKNLWTFPERDLYFAIKVLSTSGRAITQSRYKSWNKKSEHVQYLKSIRNDEYFESAVSHLAQVKTFLQKDHVILLSLLKRRQYSIIVTLLSLKNKLK